MKPLHIALLVPFFGGSHKQWATGWQQYSYHTIDLYTLPGRHWKWRMHGSAITLAEQVNQTAVRPDIIVATDMLDVTVLRSLLKASYRAIPIVLYMHENQLTYPWSPDDKDTTLARDRHYAFINYTSALAADAVWFNSNYHKTSFLAALQGFLQAFPDYRNKKTVATIQNKCRVMPLGLPLSHIDPYRQIPKPPTQLPTLLWNHRWEHDKGPEEWHALLRGLTDRGIAFSLIVMGESFGHYPAIFDTIKSTYSSSIRHWGYAASSAEYYALLCEADIAPVTSNHDFFGASVVEAIYANVIPVLPNRLAYPEHIPLAYHRDYFYQSREEALSLLADKILHLDKWRQQTLSHFVQRYDWQHQAPAYDQAIGVLIAG